MRRVLCFLLGHDERLDGFFDPNYCARCWIEDPQKDVVLPVLLTRALNWATDHSALIDRFFVWTCMQPWHTHLPAWWKY